MSGPIVRKYGFPNFEKIFGERPVQHGAEETDTTQPDSTGLPPDLEKHSASRPSAASSSQGKISPATEFGTTAE
jgi:hypothetical protein